MKEAVVLILVSVFIVAAIGIWLANGASLQFFSFQPAAVQPATPAEKGVPKEIKTAKPVKVAKAARKAAVQPVADATPAPEPTPVAPVAQVVIAPPAPAPPPKQFPAANQVTVGVARENIAEQFGQPALATTTTSGDGRVMETLVYARKSGRDVTVIRIEDGRVLSAYSR